MAHLDSAGRNGLCTHTLMSLSCIVDPIVQRFQRMQKIFLRNGTELAQVKPQALV
jgi:hypothetical protein